MASEREDSDQLELWPFEAIECDRDTRETCSSSTSTRVRAACQRPGPQGTEPVQTPDSGPRIVLATANDDERLWSIAQLARYLGVSKDTIYGWRKSGYGPPASKVGKHLRWRPVDVTTGSTACGRPSPPVSSERMKKPHRMHARSAHYDVTRRGREHETVHRVISPPLLRVFMLAVPRRSSSCRTY